MKTTIVTTTINIPVLLMKYAQNAKCYGHTELDFIVIGDRKSPAETADFCRRVEMYYPCAYFDIPAQQKYMSGFPALWEHLCFDSIQRRNIGMLMAYENGADVVITIDDDNFVMNQDFVGLHGRVGMLRELPTYGSTNNWFNVCSFLETDHAVPFYHRGYPQKMRWTEENQFISSYERMSMVAVNAGFWLDNPDIDALTRMDRQIIVRGYKQTRCGNFALEPGTWSPFNSQNTSLMRDCLPAYFLSPYIGRYDDIWASYIVERICEHFGHVVCYGDPLVRQERNPHDLWKDLDAERNGMMMTDDFCAALRSITLKGTSYHECFAEITCGLEQAWTIGPKWNESQKEWRSKLLQGMNIWHEVFDKVGVGPGKMMESTTQAPAKSKAARAKA
jgi:hypothetical protein